MQIATDSNGEPRPLVLLNWFEFSFVLLLACQFCFSHYILPLIPHQFTTLLSLELMMNWGQITRELEHSKYEINECESPNKTCSLPNWNSKEYVHFVDSVLSPTAYISFSVRCHPLTPAKGIRKISEANLCTNTQEQRSGESQKTASSNKHDWFMCKSHRLRRISNFL